MGNFRWRFETALNYLANNLLALGRLGDVEVLVTDWGSDEPLHTALNLSPAARRIVRYLIVPPAIAREEQKDSPFPIVIAQNAAVRRCRAEFIAQTDSDIMFTPEFLMAFLKALDARQANGVALDRSLVFAKRRHVPWSYAAENPSIAEMHWYLRRFGRFLPVERFLGFTFAGTGLMLMHRDLWNECSGYDERLIYWGWMEIDLGLRVRRKYPLFDLRQIGLTAYHLEHYPSRRASNNPRKLNPTDWNNAFQPNAANWGMIDRPLEIYVYPDQSDVLDVETYPPARLNRRLLKVILRTFGKWLWFPFQQLGYIPFVIKRTFHHVGVISQRVKGQPVTKWPGVIKSWWVERRQRR
ncbi:MAG TPA: glycosyltransferase, partial [Anaerolineae bacterium]|nr:glycosyltransferase [Anaerolineae bacterium]